MLDRVSYSTSAFPTTNFLTTPSIKILIFYRHLSTNFNHQITSKNVIVYVIYAKSTDSHYIFFEVKIACSKLPKLLLIRANPIFSQDNFSAS